MTKLISGRCYVRIKDSNLPMEHPDGWTLHRRFRNEMIQNTAVYVKRATVAGVEVLLFDYMDSMYAQPLSARSWDDDVGAPSNRDALQEEQHKIPVKRNNDEK